MSRIGKRIKEERLKKGLPLKQLRRKCGVSESFILDIESGSKIINEKLLAQISKVLGVNLEENMALQSSNEEEIKKEAIPKKSKSFIDKATTKRSEVEPLPQWEEALSNIIKKVPIYDMDMSRIKDYKHFPILDKKVEGFHPDKLIYIQLGDDSLSPYRMRKGDRCLIYLNREFVNGSFNLVEYDNKKRLRKLKKVTGNKLQLIEGTQDDKMVVKDIKEVKIIGRLIRVEIDF